MEIDNIVDDFFGDQNQRYQDMPASPIKPEAIAKMIQELHGQLQSRNRQSQRSERTTDLVSVGKAKATLTITADNLEWREGTQDNFRVDHFSEKTTREKFIALYNQKKASQAAKTTTEKKELEVFQEIPDEVKYYDECFLKMANIASIQGLQELFAPNFVLNAYYFMTVSDSPGYASYILNYCIKNLTSHIPVGWYFAASDQKKEIDKTKFCECASIPEDDFEINLRLPEGEQKFDFTDETSLHELVDPILENTENSEGLGLMLFAHTSHEKTIQLKEKDLQKRLFKDILATLHLLADNGHLIIKIYTAFQRLSVELLFLLFALFEEVRIVKLNASHPRKLERFAVCTKFKQALGKELREKMASLLPKLSSDEFSKEDIGMFNLFLVKTSPDFAKFADGANKVFMQKLVEKLNQPKTSKSDKIDARQAKRLMGKWKLMELSESDISDQEADNRQQNYRNRGQYNNNDSRPQRDNRDNRDFDGGRGRGGRGGFRGNRGGNRGGDYRRHDGSDDRQRRDRSDDRAMDRPRYDRSNDRDNRQNDRGRYDRSNDRHHNRDNRGYGGDRDRGGRGDRGKMTDEERFKRAEKKEVRQADIMNKDLSIPSFDVFGFIGLGGTGGGKKGKEK